MQPTNQPTQINKLAELPFRNLINVYVCITLMMIATLVLYHRSLYTLSDRVVCYSQREKLTLITYIRMRNRRF